MRCFTAFAAAAAGSLLGLPLADARIQGFATPKTIAVGKSFSVLFEGVDYIQTVSEVAAAFGIATEQSAYPGTIGTQVGAAKFSPSESNRIGNVSVDVTIPEKGLLPVHSGPVILSAALFEIYGASGLPSVEVFNVTTTLGNETSSEYVGTTSWVSTTD